VVPVVIVLCVPWCTDEIACARKVASWWRGSECGANSHGVGAVGACSLTSGPEVMLMDSDGSGVSDCRVNGHGVGAVGACALTSGPEVMLMDSDGGGVSDCRVNGHGVGAVGTGACALTMQRSRHGSACQG
jgi:hypothetical protein